MGRSSRLHAEGVLEAARADLAFVYDALETELARREYVSGVSSIADIALFPHIASARAMEVEYSRDQHPNIARWFKQMRSLDICMADLDAPATTLPILAVATSRGTRSSGGATESSGCWHGGFTTGFSKRYKSDGSPGRTARYRHP